MTPYLHATQEAGKQFYLDFHDKGKIVMLNLLKYREIADYTGLDAIRPEKEISGKEAYALYSQFTLPILQEVGSRVIFFGRSHHFLIGPETEQWDAVLLIEHPSVQTFMAFAQDENYLRTAGHRTAALADSRLLPMSELSSL